MAGYETLQIASLSRGWSTPFNVTATEEVHHETFLKLFQEGNFHGVLKRDYSMKEQHVIHPTTQNPVDKIKKALQVEKDTWGEVEDFFGRPMWFIQPFVSQLLQIGEVRCFIVSGRLLHKVTTTPINHGPGAAWQVYDDKVLRPLHTHV